MILPVITLYQPWATWIMRGWKTIETRTHNRFGCLKNKRILIHAGLTTDANAINNPYLTKEQLLFNPDEMVNGYILGSAFVNDYMRCTEISESKALIECNTERFGLYLDQIQKWETPHEVSGGMGIWYFDTDKMEKVRKPKLETQKLF